MTDETKCQLCGETYSLHDGCDTSAYCDSCVHTVIEQQAQMLTSLTKKYEQRAHDLTSCKALIKQQANTIKGYEQLIKEKGM